MKKLTAFALAVVMLLCCACQNSAQSDEYSQKCALAEKHIRNNEFAEAVEIYTALAQAGFSEAEDKINEARFAEAEHLIHKKQFTDAYNLLLGLEKAGVEGATDKLNALSCKWARSLAAKKDYVNAYKKVVNTVDCEEAEKLRDKYIAEIYADAQYNYEHRYYQQANDMFIVIPADYERCADYRLLAKAHLLGPASHYDEIAALIGFADAGELLLIYDKTAFQFLTGEWTDDGGAVCLTGTKKSIEFSNLPTGAADCQYLTIEKSRVYGYTRASNGKAVDIVKDMRITIIDYDTISVHCYKDGKDHTLHRVTE